VIIAEKNGDALMIPQKSKLPKRYQPKGFKILHEDKAIIVGIKAAGFLTVAAKWNKDQTVHSALNEYVRKGNYKSQKRVYVVHRLDQGTSGVLIFAKTEEAQICLKDNWKNTKKIYYAVVHGRLAKKSGLIESYLVEDEDYMMHATSDKERGKFAQTAYSVIKEKGDLTLVEINLLTGRKNQIRVHFSDEGHPVVGDDKYTEGTSRSKRLALHSKSISFAHPVTGEPLTFEAPVPEYFRSLVGKW